MNLLIRSLYISLIAIGLSACANSSDADSAEISEAGETAEAEATATEYALNTSKSILKWKGYKPTGQHHGTINFKSGVVAVKDNIIQSGKMVFDMTSLVVKDEDMSPDNKAKLEGHLKGTREGKEDDFFNTKGYPTAKFELTNVSKVENESEGTMMVSGNLTIKEITKEVSFMANVDINDQTLSAETPWFKIDRTRWNINFKSKSIFDDLKNDFINDEVDIKIEITASKGSM